jgi:hypothetical protein
MSGCIGSPLAIGNGHSHKKENAVLKKALAAAKKKDWTSATYCISATDLGRARAELSRSMGKRSFESSCTNATGSSIGSGVEVAPVVHGAPLLPDSPPQWVRRSVHFGSPVLASPSSPAFCQRFDPSLERRFCYGAHSPSRSPLMTAVVEGDGPEPLPEKGRR